MKIEVLIVFLSLFEINLCLLFSFLFFVCLLFQPFSFSPQFRTVPAIIGFYQGRQVALNVASFDELTAAHILDFGGSMLPHAPALLSATQADAFLKAGSVPTPSSASYSSSSSSSSSPDALPAAAKVKVVLLYNKRTMPLVFRVMAAKFHGMGSDICLISLSSARLCLAASSFENRSY
jgi:hypothetical protein